MKKLLVVVSVVMALPVMSLACSIDKALSDVEQAVSNGKKATLVAQAQPEPIDGTDTVIMSFLVDGGNGAQYEASYNYLNAFDEQTCNLNGIVKVSQ